MFIKRFLLVILYILDINNINAFGLIVNKYNNSTRRTAWRTCLKK
jgi:hypothetical protein